MRHVDLFSGLGGFALAASWCWPDHEVIAFAECDPFCQQVLKKHWPDTPIIPDVRNVNAETIGEIIANANAERCVHRQVEKHTTEAGVDAQCNATADNRTRIDLLTGGFPCQPFSHAGKRKGSGDDRALWPEMFRVIRELHPRWVVGENVSGLLTIENGVVFERCCADLESEGYTVQPCIIPACAVGAPHRRDRVWIVAHATGNGSGRTAGEICKADGRPGRTLHIGTVDADRHAADTTDNRLHDIGAERGIQPGTFNWECVGKTCWDEPWLEAAQRFCQLDDGLSYRLDGYLTFPVTYGIMGLILTLRRYHYATTLQDRDQALSMLRETTDQESVSQFFGMFWEVHGEEILRCPVHGERETAGKDNPVRMDGKGKEIQGEKVCDVRDNQASEYSSQERGLHGQCSCEFDDIVFELSSKIALGEWKNNTEAAHNILFGLWKESRGERFLHDPLSALHEIWRSVTDKEIGSFRRHYLKRNENRVQRLKAAGNAIVPQVAYQIMQAIKEVDK